MSVLTQTKRYTPDEYLALEEEAEYKSEYENGEIVAMSGATISHVRISTNIAREIGIKISKDCEALTNDIRVWVQAPSRFYYPDVTALRGEPSFYQDRDDTITNPILIVEVLSKSTERKDRGDKFMAYQKLESVREYVLVSQDKPVVEQVIKQPDGSWKYLATIGLESLIKLESINIELSLSEIFYRVNFKQENL